MRLFGVLGHMVAGAKMQLQFDGYAGPAGTHRRAPRAEVGAVSSPSRRRLREAVWSVQPALLPRRAGRGRWHRPASFVTLTYPIEDLPRHIADPRLHKIHLDVFWKALQRFAPDSWAVWVLEFQQNGSPHLHLVCRWHGVQSKNWMEVRVWCASTWAAIIAVGRDGDDDGLIRGKSKRAGTSVEPVVWRKVSGRGLAEYVAKAGTKASKAKGSEGDHDQAQPVAVSVAAELAKRTQKNVRIVGQGRWWGICNRRGYAAACSVLDVELPKAIGFRLWRAIKADWREYFERSGANPDDIEHLPTWLSADYFKRALRETQAEEVLWSSPRVDAKTGELIELTAEDLAGAASA